MTRVLLSFCRMLYTYRFWKTLIGALVKLNRQAGECFVLSISGAKAPDKSSALIAALKRCAAQKHSFITAGNHSVISVCGPSVMRACSFFVLALLLVGSAVSAQDKDADKTAV